jgi:hypothetical protein
VVTVRNGWLLPINILLLLAGPAMFITSFVMAANRHDLCLHPKRIRTAPPG